LFDFPIEVRYQNGNAISAKDLAGLVPKERRDDNLGRPKETSLNISNHIKK